MRSAGSTRLLLAACATLVTTGARAEGGLQIVPLDGSSWAAHIAFWQSAPAPPGSAFRVRVLEDDTHRAAGCGSYALALDAAGTQALRVGRCDPADGSTEVLLADRAALFGIGPEGVPEPLMVGVSAVSVRQGGAAGGAAPSAGLEFRCVASVRPYVDDLLHNVHVYLSPERYRLATLDPRAHAEVDPNGRGWVITAASGEATFDAAFRVLDARDGREVARSRVAMRCTAQNAADDPGTPASTPSGTPSGTREDPFRLPAGSVAQGSTLGGGAAQLACTGGPAPAVVWRYTAPADGDYEFLLQGGFETALEVHHADDSAQPRGALACNGGDGRPTHARVALRLRQGERYDVVVGGEAGEAGRYELAVIRIPSEIVLGSESAPDRAYTPGP